METPVLIMPSTILHEKRWACVITGIIVFIITAPIISGITFILVDYKFGNKPIQVIERNVLNNSGGQRIYVTEDMDHWFLSDDSAVKLTPIKKEK